MHCVLQFPEDEIDFATRWRLIKMEFSKALPKSERLSKVRANRGERGIGNGVFGNISSATMRTITHTLAIFDLSPVGEAGDLPSGLGWWKRIFAAI
jgi:hypothetical protein